MVYYSVENLKTETLDRETRNRILSLSYEKFFQDSVNNETEVTNLNKSIEAKKLMGYVPEILKIYIKIIIQLLKFLKKNLELILLKVVKLVELLRINFLLM